MLNIPTHIVTTGIFVENSAHQVLMVNHPTRGWEMPGGILDKGENIMESIQRQLDKQGNWVIQSHQLIAVYSDIQEDFVDDRILPTKIIFDFRCSIVGDQSIEGEALESMKWVDRSELISLSLSEIMKMRIDNYLEFNRAVLYTSYMREPFEVKIRTEI
ncbi:MAG: NUDIX hydrolase [Bacteroidetes bacterium]|nr:NUDIX hydrolase [Bacteroidota bacterium]